jgi:hypothetical protein
MRTINIEINKNQLFRIFDHLDENEKFEIFNRLKKSLFLKRFNSLLESTKTDELSLEEITNEVESVRKHRYEKGEQII